MQRALNYDPKLASNYDNGIFWMDYASLLKFYDVFYINWNPELFQYTYCIHQSWSAGVGPTKDAYNIGDNPQFSLAVPAGMGSVWIQLTRHITTIEDFRENKEYITVLVYKTNGNRVYYPCKYFISAFFISKCGKKDRCQDFFVPIYFFSANESHNYQCRNYLPERV